MRYPFCGSSMSGLFGSRGCESWWGRVDECVSEQFEPMRVGGSVNASEVATTVDDPRPAIMTGPSGAGDDGGFGVLASLVVLDWWPLQWGASLNCLTCHRSRPFRMEGRWEV